MMAEIGLILSIFDKLLDRTPTYDQRQRKKYAELKSEYKAAKEADIVDLYVVDSLRDKLMQFIGGEVKVL